MAGIRDVAKIAGVSMSTVSQVITGKRPVAADTRARVEKAIAELDYRPHPAASQLRGGRTGTIALIVPALTNPFYPLVAAGMQDVLLGRDILLTVTDVGSSGRSGTTIHQLLTRRVDGMVVAPFGIDDADLAALRSAGIPFVTLGASHHAAGDVVHTDDVLGGEEITSHLIERGYERIAFLGGDEHATPTVQRLEGYRRALQAAGREPSDADIVFEDFTREGGRRGATALLDRDERPDAIVAANDLIAIGALDIAREGGISVPDSLAITGYDDIDAASLVSPALTTVENPAREIGRACARLLLERLDGERDGDAEAVTRTVTLSHRLVIRESSTPRSTT